LSSTLTARTGFPFDVTTVDRGIGLGFDNSGRADLVRDVPIWISNSALPGGRELNPAAFAFPASGQNGTLGRNVLTGAGLFQIDLSLRRQFQLFHALSMETSLSAFNALNHPEFSSPVKLSGQRIIRTIHFKRQPDARFRESNHRPDPALSGRRPQNRGIECSFQLLTCDKPLSPVQSPLTCALR